VEEEELSETGVEDEEAEEAVEEEELSETVLEDEEVSI
jgi:hypothetical protein